MYFESLDSNLNILCDVGPSKKFGDIQVVLAGDFGQLPPPKCKPLYDLKNQSKWEDSVNTFLVRRSNHRFKDDEHWGELLKRFQKEGPTDDDVNFINTKNLNKVQTFLKMLLMLLNLTKIDVQLIMQFLTIF